MRTFLSILRSIGLLQKIASQVLIFVILVLAEMSEVVVRAKQYLLQSSRVSVRYHIALTELSGRYRSTLMLVLKRDTENSAPIPPYNPRNWSEGSHDRNTPINSNSREISCLGAI